MQSNILTPDFLSCPEMGKDCCRADVLSEKRADQMGSTTCDDSSEWDS